MNTTAPRELADGAPPARCSDLSLAAGEPLGATATTAEQWLVLEVPGAWPRDVGAADALSARASASVARWRDASLSRRVLFARRPGRGGDLSAFVVTATETDARVRRIGVGRPAELAHLDFETAGIDVETGLVLVCGHGSRDACCALHGTAVFGALAEVLGADELWISSHQGGHRFAANVLVLPVGIQFGRVPPSGASAIVARALAGEIDLEHYRGRTCYPADVQAAEQAIRLEEGLMRLEDLRLVDVGGPVVRFRGRDGRERAAMVEPIAGPRVPASCGAPSEPQPALSARVLR